MQSKKQKVKRIHNTTHKRIQIFEPLCKVKSKKIHNTRHKRIHIF